MHDYKITFKSKDLYQEGKLIVIIQAPAEVIALGRFIDIYGVLEPTEVEIQRSVSDNELMQL